MASLVIMAGPHPHRQRSGWRTRFVSQCSLVFERRLVWRDAIKRGPPEPIKARVAEPLEAQNGLPIPLLRNLPLAARPRVGHIDRNGAVAEWLKAAGCLTLLPHPSPCATVPLIPILSMFFDFDRRVHPLP